MAEWTFITVTYNSAATLTRFWSQPIPEGVEWIVVDNASADDTVAVAEGLGARVIALPTNVGFGTANNVALKASEGRYVAFVNPDLSPNFDSLTRLEQSLEEHGGLVSPQLINPDGSLQPNGRGLPTLASKVRNRLSSSMQNDSYQVLVHPGEEVSVDWFIGAAVLGSRETFEALGGWDERFFIYYEDSDIGLRAWRAGLSVRVVGDEQWVHGWARATTKFRLSPWMRELSSMSKFYAKYPTLLGSVAFARRSFPGHRGAVATRGGSL